MVFKIKKYISFNFWSVAYSLKKSGSSTHWLTESCLNSAQIESYMRVSSGCYGEFFLQVQKPAFTGLSLTVRYGKPTPATPERERESEGGT